MLHNGFNYMSLWKRKATKTKKRSAVLREQSRGRKEGMKHRGFLVHSTTLNDSIMVVLANFMSTIQARVI